MTILRFEGIVKVGYEDNIFIDDTEVIREILSFDFDNELVTVAFADETFNGDLEAYPELAGYSEWTPGSPAEFTVGEHNIIEAMRRYEGQRIILWMADEPINTLDPPPSWANQDKV